MKFPLLVAASALIVGLSLSGPAFARGDHNRDPHQQQKQSQIMNTALAGSIQAGRVKHDSAIGTAGSNYMNNVYGTGLYNLQENVGANSIQQDGNTVAAVLNCACSTSGNVANTPIALNAQVASVEGNFSLGASNTTKAGGEKSAGGYFQHASYQGQSSDPGHHRRDRKDNKGNQSFSQASGGFFTHASWWKETSDAVASNNTLIGVGGTGLFNISQNTGNNAMQQASNTVAAVIGK